MTNLTISNYKFVDVDEHASLLSDDSESELLLTLMTVKYKKCKSFHFSWTSEVIQLNLQMQTKLDLSNGTIIQYSRETNN